MDIVLGLHQFPPFAGGGTEVLAAWMADALRAKGHEVRLVSAIPHGMGLDGVALPPREVVRFVPPSPTPPTGAARIRREYDDRAMGDAFIAALDDRRPDVVHFLHLAGLTASALRATAARRIPTFFTATDFWFECPTVQRLLCDHSRCAGPRPDRLNCARHLMEVRHPALRGLSAWSAVDGPLAAPLQGALRLPGAGRLAASFQALAERSPTLLAELASIGAVIAPTAHMRERLVRFGVPESRVPLVRYGVPPPRIGLARHHGAGRLRVAYVGTLAPHKGAHLLVGALAQLQDVPLDLDLHGGPTATAYWRELDAAAQADGRIRLCGRFDAADIGRVLDDADVLAIPSLWDENAPLVLLQAIAHRCPVLVSEVPGLVEPMREGQDGWSFRYNDVDDLAAALRRLCADPRPLAHVRGTPAMIRSVDDYIADLLPLYETHVTRETVAP